MSVTLTDIPGLKVGHYTDIEAATGCTVILCPFGAIGGVDVRGSAPGTRETDLLRPLNLIREVHAVLLSGGSAFGLDAAGGVMRYLEEHHCGYATGSAVVPIVPAAVLYDLDIGSSSVRPGIEAGYRACLNASDRGVEEGCVGAGTGATVAKLFGPEKALKSGIGCSGIAIKDGVIVAALMAVNAVGDIINHANGKLIAGPRSDTGNSMLSSLEIIKKGLPLSGPLPKNTTLGVVATNVKLDKEQANKLAQMAHDGLARSIVPSHTMNDGDTIFSLSSGDKHYDLSLLGSLAAEAVSLAIERAVAHATSLAGIPAVTDLCVQE